MLYNWVVVPKRLRQEVLQSLHAAHQGVTAMTNCARDAVYWPGIPQDIESICASCFECNRIAPSQPKLPPTQPHIPTTPLRLLRVTISSTKGGATSLPQIDCLGGLNKHAFNQVPPTLAQRVYVQPFDNYFQRLAYLLSYQATNSLPEKPKPF